jgi:hypothetical protein
MTAALDPIRLKSKLRELHLIEDTTMILGNSPLLCQRLQCNGGVLYVWPFRVTSDTAAMCCISSTVFLISWGVDR